MKQTLLVIAAASALLVSTLAGCETREPQEEVRTVDWYVAHEAERTAKLAECRSRRGKAHGCDAELHQRQPRGKRGKRGEKWGTEKEGVRTEPPGSRSAVSSLAVPLKPACPAQAGGAITFQCPAEFLFRSSHPNVVDYRERIRSAGTDWSERETSEPGKKTNLGNNRIHSGAQLPAPNVMCVMCAIIICAM